MNRTSTRWLTAALSVWVFGASFTARAATNFPAALTVDDSTQLVHDRAAEALLRGRLSEALRGFNEVLKLQPFNATAYYNRGNIRYLRREFELALQDYTAALKYRPGFAAAAMNRGIAFSNLERLDEALADLDRASELDPSNSDVFFNRAIVHVKRGAMDKALADYDKIVQLDGSNPDLEATRFRLKSLLSRIDELGVVGRERNRHIVAEMDHARSIEQLLDFLDRTCIRLGDDRPGLSAVAQAGGWTEVSDKELAEVSTPLVKLTEGWKLTSRLGSMAVVQSSSVRDPSVLWCSITTRLGDPHWFEDFATLFTSRFRSPRLVIRELEGRRTSQQVVIRDDKARVEVMFSQRTDTRVFTVRTAHGKEQGVDPPNPR
ncbi:tetratricopeptide repeat protein [Hyphomicrobium sp.]|uniref:tetratricopeptide repeat protein n=1 Tax=Hyphomicrobium sp. TaxID=82 RepID=UPI002FE1F3C0